MITTNMLQVAQAPFVDVKTGQITKSAYYFLLGMFNVVGNGSDSSLDDLQTQDMFGDGSTSQFGEIAKGLTDLGMQIAMQTDNTAMLNEIQKSLNSNLIQSIMVNEFDSSQLTKSINDLLLQLAMQVEFNPNTINQRLNDVETRGLFS